MPDDPIYHWPMTRQIEYPLISEAAIAPDGGQVVYTIREPLLNAEKSEMITHLYQVSTTGGEPRQLTFGPSSNRCPRWSPDGRYLAFLSTRSDRANIYVLDASGGEAWALTAYDQTEIISLEWSPNGRHIAFLMAEPLTEVQIQAKQAKADPLLWGVDFEFSHLFRVPFAVASHPLSPVTQITTGRFHVFGFDWLPDGQTIALTHQPTPEHNDWGLARLATVSVSGGQSVKASGLEALIDIALVADADCRPKVSPDGQWIACGTAEQPNRWAFANRIVLYPVNGGTPCKLAQTPNGISQLIGWSADSNHVYVLDVDGVDSQIWRLPIGGKPGHSLTDTPSAKQWLADNGRDHIVYTDQDFSLPNVLCLLNASHCQTRPLIGPPVPADWPEAPLPKAEVIQWASFDGQPIEGILIYPLNYRANQPHPLVVHIHGGPAGVFSRHYLAAPERYCDVVGLAERGCMTLQVNPRGSTGYGKDFRFANLRDWGGGDYQDIMAGVNHLIAQGLADPGRLGIIGWSYGGFMTSWAITQTDRFKAACVGAGVTNLMSFTGTTDIPGLVPDYFEGEYWHNLAPYQQHSAMFHISGVTTPTLIQHGEVDRRVPLSQSLELYNALKRQQIPVELVIYPRQGHDITEPRLNIDLRQRALAWFERWLSLS